VVLIFFQELSYVSSTIGSLALYILYIYPVFLYHVIAANICGFLLKANTVYIEVKRYSRLLPKFN